MKPKPIFEQNGEKKTTKNKKEHDEENNQIKTRKEDKACMETMHFKKLKTLDLLESLKM